MRDREADVIPLAESRDITGATRGRFFAVDRSSWRAACALGMNPSAAYLVLACGTRGHHGTTKWSRNAISKYADLSRIKAKEAVGALIKNKLVSVIAVQGGNPTYRLNLPEPPSDALDTRDEEEPAEDDDRWIYLPNSLVVGAAAETPPVAKLRQGQDVWTLQLFIELYGDQHLRRDHGVRRTVVMEKYQRRPLGSKGEFRVWGFRTPRQWTSWQGAAAPFVSLGEKRVPEFFGRIEYLQQVGLLQFVPHLVEGEHPDSEVLHSLGDSTSTSAEDCLREPAQAAGYALLTEESELWAANCEYVVPVLSHIRNVQLVGIARLRYRAHTSAAAAWQQRLHHDAENYLKMYASIRCRLRT